MTRSQRTLSCLAPLALAAALAQPAHAGPSDACSANAFGWSAGPAPTFVNGCFEEDKYYQGISTNLTPEWLARTGNVDVGGVGDSHFVEFKEFEHGNLQLGVPYSLRGTVQVRDGFPKTYISAIDLDLDGGFGPAGQPFVGQVVKNVYADANFTQLLLTLTSTGAFTFGAIPWTKQVWFEDIITITSGTLLTVENSFRQSVPAPASLALVLAALGGMAVSRRRTR